MIRAAQAVISCTVEWEFLQTDKAAACAADLALLPAVSADPSCLEQQLAIHAAHAAESVLLPVVKTDTVFAEQRLQVSHAALQEDVVQHDAGMPKLLIGGDLGHMLSVVAGALQTTLTAANLTAMHISP